MLVVVGSPSAGRAADGRTVAAGLGAEVARRAAAAGAAVQIVGRVGEDPAGDAVLLDLAAADVGHVAVLRTAGEPTPLSREGATGDADDGPVGAALAEGEDAAGSDARGLPLDAADLELALRYLPDYRVIVVTPGLDPAAITTVVAAAAWSGAQLVAVGDGAAGVEGFPPDATVLAQPADADAAFAAVVARYATELDRGAEPAVAFATASSETGWHSVEA